MRGGIELEGVLRSSRPTNFGPGKDDPNISQGSSKDLGKETIEEFQKMQKEKQEREGEQRPSARTGTTRVRPRKVLRFTRDEKKLLISGGLSGGSELASAPAVVDCKLDEGHMVLFSINPMWRHQTHGSYSLVLNAMLHYDHLDAGK